MSAINPGAFALVGMAATFSAVARAPLTSILTIFEITGDYGLVLPLMVAAAISTILAGRVRPESAYSAPLARMGIHPVSGEVTDLLDTVHVEDVARRSFVSVAPTATLSEVQATMERSRLQGLPVVIDGTLLGVVAASDVMRAGGPSDQVTAADVMTPNPTTVTLSTPVSEALERMAALGVGRLPVVDENDRTRLITMFRREDVVAAYHKALGATAQARSRGDQFGAPTDSDTRFFELAITSGSLADGGPISEIPWPEGCVVVSIHRGPRLLVPNGRTIIQAGDAITAFGSNEARDRLTERLAPAPDFKPVVDVPDRATN